MEISNIVIWWISFSREGKIIIIILFMQRIAETKHFQHLNFPHVINSTQYWSEGQERFCKIIIGFVQDENFPSPKEVREQKIKPEANLLSPNDKFYRLFIRLVWKMLFKWFYNSVVNWQETEGCVFNADIYPNRLAQQNG